MNGELLIEKKVEVKNKPQNLNLVLGTDGLSFEYPGQTTSLNIFSASLTLEQMKSQTSPGVRDCGLGGDFLSWAKSVEEEQWTLHSKTRWVDLDAGLEGPCKAKPKLNVFPMKGSHLQSDCMKHCKKLGGRSPSLKTKKDWENLVKEVKAVSPDPQKLPGWFWLSATEGDVGGNLGKLDHWPQEVKAEEGVWRDYYTGEMLKNYTKPWLNYYKDKEVGDTYNCLHFSPKGSDAKAWYEWECHITTFRGCPCSYDSPPLLHLRGFCPNTMLEHTRYTVAQLATEPNNIIFVGALSAQIKFNSTISQWVYSDSRFDVAARSRASQNSFALGKNNWTVSDDNYKCFEGKKYTLVMKLTGCYETQFTCDDGQCIKMEERCNQLPDCEDKSDEYDCKILALEKGYNQRVPPVSTIISGEKRTLEAVDVNVSLTLFKVVAIAEEDHSIELQFQINLEWKENRATYHNLKLETYLNALSQEEINSLWLPLVIYINTDQQETTRLSALNEWSTDVNVKREGNFTRNGYGVLDETYLFK